MKEDGAIVEKREEWSVGGITRNKSGDVGWGPTCGKLCQAEELECYPMG